MSNTKIYAAPLIYRDTIVEASSWVSSTTYPNYQYEAEIVLNDVTDSYVPEVSFLPSDAMLYMFAPHALATHKKIIIYAMKKPEDTLMIPTIICTNGKEFYGIGIDNVLDPILNNNSWKYISLASQAEIAESIWSIGDTKQIVLNGKIGTLDLSNYTTYVYIIGFNHNSGLEGNGITFGTFKDINNTDFALIDSKYSSTDTNDTKYFTMNHWGNSCYGGWAGCDLRYDILGSTDVAPSDYGTKVTAERVGYNASPTCATHPVPDTLMAALPFELRAVMKPMTIYTDNVSNGSSSESSISATIDYLPLLSEFEILGTRSYSSSYEQKKQDQYDYYLIGNSKIKYKYNDINTAVRWTLRSPRVYYTYYFCHISATGSSDFNYVY